MIDGVVVTPLRQIPDERGRVMHMLREDWPVFQRFGEVYFSTVNNGAIKAWHLHKRATINYAVPVGEIKFVLYDDRPGSATRGEIQEIFMSPQNYQLVTVPPLVWNGFKGISEPYALVVNCVTMAHEPGESERKPALDPSIPYDWNIQYR